MMTKFEDSYLGKIRSLVGNTLLRVPGTRIIIENEKDQILLQKRSDFNIWGLPGGSGELGETVEDTIKREVFEETGLSLLSVTPIGYATNPKYEVITFPNGHVCHFHSFIFYSNSYTNTLSSDSFESIELSWCDPENLPQMLENMSRTVDAFKAYKETNQFQLF